VDTFSGSEDNKHTFSAGTLPRTPLDLRGEARKGRRYWKGKVKRQEVGRKELRKKTHPRKEISDYGLVCKSGAETFHFVDISYMLIFMCNHGATQVFYGQTWRMFTLRVFVFIKF